MTLELFGYPKFTKKQEICYLVCCCAVLFIEPYPSELKEENRTDAEVGR